MTWRMLTGWLVVVVLFEGIASRRQTCDRATPLVGASYAAEATTLRRPATDGQQLVSSRSTVPRPKVTAEGQRSIEMATAWLKQAINSNGSVGPDIGAPPDLGCTAIAGLALLSQGNTPDSGPHSQELRQILHYLLNVIERTPEDAVPLETQTQIQRKIGRYAPLFLMTLFLSQVHGESSRDDQAIQSALDRLVRAITAAQQADGTWGNESWAPVLGTVLGWECLRACASAGIDVDASTERIGQALVKNMKERNEVDVSHWMFNFYKETSSLRVLYSLGYNDDPDFQEGVSRVLQLPHAEPRLFTEAGGEEFLAFYLVTECMLKQEEDSWAEWYPVVSSKMVGVQNADGSWTGHHCITSRTFCTAAAMITLQAPYQCLPSSDF